MKCGLAKIERVFPHPNPLPEGEGTNSLLPPGEGLGMREHSEISHYSVGGNI